MEKLRVAILNSSQEIIDVLAEVFKEEGYDTCTSFAYLYKGDDQAFDRFINQCKPDVIIYDVAIPYKENYALFKKLSEHESVSHIPFILTTTNKTVLESLVGKTSTHELVGKPYDLHEIVNAVEHARKQVVI